MPTLAAMDRYIDAGGVQIHVIDHGGEGQPLVLAPGLTSNCHIFDGLVANGLLTGAQAFAFDLRGRGESDRPVSGYSLADHAGDVMAALDSIGVDMFVMGGHSFGAMLSFWMAAAHPDRIMACVALDPPEGIDEEVKTQIKPAVDRLSRAVSSVEEYLENAKAMPYYAGWWDPSIEPHYEADLEEVDGGFRPKTRPENIEEVVDSCVAVDWAETVKSVHQPTLVVRATRPYGPPGAEALLTAVQAERIVSRLDDGLLVEVDGNHMTMLFGDAAPRTTAAILEFLQGV